MYTFLIVVTVIAALWASARGLITQAFYKLEDERAAGTAQALARVEALVDAQQLELRAMAETVTSVKTNLTIPYAYGGLPTSWKSMDDAERAARERPTIEAVVCDLWRMEKTLNEVHSLIYNSLRH